MTRMTKKAIISIENYFIMISQKHLGTAKTGHFATSPLLTETLGLVTIFRACHIVNIFEVSSHAYINRYGMYVHVCM